MKAGWEVFCAGGIIGQIWLPRSGGVPGILAYGVAGTLDLHLQK